MAWSVGPDRACPDSFLDDPLRGRERRLFKLRARGDHGVEVERVAGRGTYLMLARRDLPPTVWDSIVPETVLPDGKVVAHYIFQAAR